MERKLGSWQQCQRAGDAQDCKVSGAHFQLLGIQFVTAVTRDRNLDTTIAAAGKTTLPVRRR